MDFSDILLVSDYDNTLTGEKHLVPHENINAILEFTAGGGAFTIASGRGRREWYESFRCVPFNAPLILGNGAVIYDTVSDKALFQTEFSEKQKRAVKELIMRLPKGLGVMIEASEDMYIPDEIYRNSDFRGFPGAAVYHPPLDDIPGAWDKVSFMPPFPPFDISKGELPDISGLDTDIVDEIQRAAEGLGINGIRSLPFMYEIPPEGTDKGTSALKLKAMLGKKVFAAIGDAPNDLGMLRAADICFVPAGSILETEGMIPEHAIITARCEDASIADVAEKLRDLF